MNLPGTPQKRNFCPKILLYLPKNHFLNEKIFTTAYRTNRLAHSPGPPKKYLYLKNFLYLPVKQILKRKKLSRLFEIKDRMTH